MKLKRGIKMRISFSIFAAHIQNITIMKNIKFLSLFALLAVGALFFSSCGGTDETPDPKPVLNFLAGVDFLSEDTELSANTAFKIAITASHVDDITSFKIIQSLDGTTDVDVFDSTDIKTKLISEYIYSGTTGANAGSEIYTFEVSDKDGNTTTKAIKITNLGDPGNNLEQLEVDNNDNPWRIYNFRGPQEGAFGITVGSALFQSAPENEKDIQDSTTSAETWPARWTSRNGSTFKKLSGGEWNTITNDATLKAAWDNGGTAQSVVNIAEGDVYAMKLAGGDDYALVLVTEVNRAVARNEYVQFVFKRQVK